MNESPDPRRFYLRKEVADILGVSEVTVWRGRRGGRIPFIIVNNRKMTPGRWLKKMLNSSDDKVLM